MSIEDAFNRVREEIRLKQTGLGKSTIISTPYDMRFYGMRFLAYNPNDPDWLYEHNRPEYEKQKAALISESKLNKREDKW